MILLLGSSGYIGQAFKNHFRARGMDFQSLQLSHESDPKTALVGAIRKLRPSFLINSAGFTGKPNVDVAESHKAECLEANISLALLVAGVCGDFQLPWGHVSSGCIFQGSKPDHSGFTEEDTPNFDFRHNNCSFYSGTKALAEEVIRDAPQCYIWRLRIPFNQIDNPRNYLTKIMHYERLLDVRNSISQVDEFVRACCETRQRELPFGIYHMTNPGSVTTREVTALIEKHGLGRPGGYRFFTDEAEFMLQAAITPRASCVLDSSKLARHGVQMTEVHEALDQCLRNWKSRPGIPPS